MKKILLILWVLVTLFTNSCYEPAMGSGVIIEEPRFSTQIISVENQSIGKVFIQQGANQSVKIKTDDNFIKKIITKTIGQKLVISNEGEIAPSILEIYVTINDISSLELSGSGSIISKNNFNQSSTLFLSNSGSGNISIATVSTKSLELSNSGSGDINISSINIISNASSNNISSGDIKIEDGDCPLFDFSSTGSGSTSTQGMNIGKSNIEILGSGSIYLWITNELNAVISGSGNIYYWGNPVINQNITGSGKIIKKD